MATVEDAILSVYKEVTAFAASEGLEFVSTSSMETASTILMNGEDKLVLVQHELKDEQFLTIDFRIFVALSASNEVNALKTTEIMSRFFKTFPKFSKICIYEASGLKQEVSTFVDTKRALVVASIGQTIISITQMRNNLSAIAFKLTGFIH